MLIANADGTNEKMFLANLTLLLRNQYPGHQTENRSLHFARAGESTSVIEFWNAASAKVQAVVPFNKTQLNDLAWLPDGRSLVVTYQNNAIPFARAQIGLLFAKATEFRAITKDTNSYRTLTLSADGKALATVQQKTTRTLYLLPAGGFSGSPPDAASAQLKDSFAFHWTSNGEPVLCRWRYFAASLAGRRQQDDRAQ